MATYDAGDARLRIVPDASKFREQLDTQLRGQQAEFVIQVAADAQKAQEKIDALRREQEDRAIRLRVQAEDTQAERKIDELRAEQEARPIDLRVNVDESGYSRLSRAVDSARQQVLRANEAVIASDRRVDAARRQSASAADAVVASERREANVRLQLEGIAQRIAAAEQHVNDVRQNQAAQVNPLLIAAENALERARAKGKPADIARSERNLAEMRKALGPQSDEVTRAENALADVRRRGQILENSLAQAIDSGAGARRRAQGAEDSLAQSLDNSSAARRRAEQSSRNLARTVEDENQKARDLSRDLKMLGKDFETAVPISGFADAFRSMAPFIAMLPALATGLAEAAGAAEQLGGAVLSWPGMFAALGSSFGTLLTGIHGMGDAYKALSTSAKDAGNDQATHARETREANEQLTSATRAQGEAEHERARAVRDSRQEMEDLNLQLRGGQLDTAQAILDAQKARQDLATGHYSNALDYQQAQLRVLESDQHVAESIQSQSHLRERQADIGDRVVSANDRVADANDRVAKAQEHLNDVANKASASQRALNTAMAQLAPNAQEFVKTIYGLVHSGPLKDLQTNTQQNLFAGMSTSIKNLVNSDLPTLKTGFGSIATSMNADFKQLFSSLGSDHTKGLLANIFGDTSHAQELLKTAIDPLVNAFGTLARAGADTIPRMADGIGRAADRFSKFIDAADKDGRLDAWINGGITGFTHLGNIFINLGQSLNGITKALGGQGFLATLEDATKRLDAFLNSTKGQDDLRRIFADGRAELEQIKPILENLPAIFKSAFSAARDAMGLWMPLLREGSTLLKDFPRLTQAIFDGFLAWKTLGPVFSFFRDGLDTAVRGLGSVQTQITNSRVLADSEMSRTAGIFKSVAGEEGVGKFAGALGMLSKAGGPIALLATVAIPGLEVAFDALNQKHKETQAAVDQLNQSELELEGTLDRVTGKVTAQTRQTFLQGGKGYDASGRAGGGIPGISKGDAVTAAQKLGISPDLYASAGVGDKNAQQQVENILIKNNLLPELAANPHLRDILPNITKSTGGQINQDLLARALIGEPDALNKYNELLKKFPDLAPSLDLSKIAQQLSPTGKQSVLAGGYLNFNLQGLPGAQQSQQQTQQGVHGRWRLSQQGANELGLPGGTQVNAEDDGYHVTIADPMPPGMADKLKALNITPQQNMYDPTHPWTFVLPLGSRDVEKYDKGGPTPHATGPLPDGGYPAIMHPTEYVANKTGRQTLGDPFLAAANQGRIDLGLLPHFDQGGAGDYYGPDLGGALSAGLGDASSGRGDDLGPTGPAPADGTGLVPAISAGIAGGTQAASTGMNALNAMPGAGGTPGAPGGGMPGAFLPGLWGLPAAMATPGGMQAWTNQTLGWLGGWAGKTLGGLGSALYSGAIGSVGLGESMLSPQNPWTQAGSNFLGGLLGKFGIGGGSGGSGGGGGGLGGILGGLMSPYGGANPAVSQVLQNGEIDPNLLNRIYNPSSMSGAIATPGVASPTGDIIAMNAASRAGTLGGANATYSPDFLAAHGIAPLFTKTTPDADSGKDIPQWARDLGAAFRLTPTDHPDSTLHGGQSGKGNTANPMGSYAFDFSGDPADMDRFAQFIKDNLAGQTLQLIHQDAATGQKFGIAGGEEVGVPGKPEYYTSAGGTYGDEQTMVHWATDVAPFINPQNSGAAMGPGMTMSTDANGAVTGSSDIKSRAQQMYSSSGLPADQWNIFDQLITRESGYSPTAKNPHSTAYGIGQFLDTTWASVGGTKTDDPTTQLAYVFKYIAQRYGTPESAWQHELQYGWYDEGGTVPRGLTLVNNQTGGDEQAAVFNRQQWNTLQSLANTSDASVAQANVPPSPGPKGPQVQEPDTPDVQQMRPRTAPPSQAPSSGGAQQFPTQPGDGTGGSGRGPQPGAPGAATAPPAGPAQLNPVVTPFPQRDTAPAGPTAPGTYGGTPLPGSHVLPALSTGITSTASTLGNLAATAMQIGAAALGAAGGPSFGGSAAGAAALGGLSGYVSGLFQEGGKVVNDIVNVPSSLMVGTLTPGTSPNASGTSYHPSEAQPATAQVSSSTYNVSGNYELDEALTRLKLKESQDQQSQLANYRGPR